MHQEVISEVLGEKGFFIPDDCMKRSKNEENELLRDLIDSNFESRKKYINESKKKLIFFFFYRYLLKL